MSSWAKLQQRIWIPPDRRDKPFRDEIRRPGFLAALAILLFTGDWLGNNIVFESPAKWLGDILLRTRGVQVPRYTRLVQIGETDREKVLLGKTPVDGPALFRALCGLAASKPAVIVVDIDTSSGKSFPKEMKDVPDFHGVKVVWAVNANWEHVDRNLVLKSGHFLGGNLFAPFGIARMPVGFDGVVREWFRSLEVNGAETPLLTVVNRLEGSIPEPSKQARANRIKLLPPQYAELADCPDNGIGCDILHQESAGFQERNRNDDLEFRSTQTGRMRHDRNQRPITISVGGAHD
jgi:hypothetical protein